MRITPPKYVNIFTRANVNYKQVNNQINKMLFFM